MHKVAIIGYLGSGKSEVLRICSELDFPTISADHIARMLLEMPGIAHDDVVKEFPDAVDTTGRIDRRKLAKEVFHYRERLILLEGIIHPHVWQIVAAFFMECEKKGEEICFVEVSAPDDTIKLRFDEMWCVSADLEIREKRCVERGMSSDDFFDRNGYQQIHVNLGELATRNIINDGNVELLRQTIESMCNDLVEKRAK